jgi:hypothetical protein
VRLLENLTDDELEQMLFDATHRDGVTGRAAMARVTAIRTILKRRVGRRSAHLEADERRALELVNATRGPDAQLTHVHPVWVASILADPEWAELYASDEEIAAGAVRLRRESNNRTGEDYE